MLSSIGMPRLRESMSPLRFGAPSGVLQFGITESGSTLSTRRKFLVYSNASITIRNMPVPALGSRFASASWNVMAEESGSSRNPEKGQPSSSPSRNTPGQSSPRRLTLLLAEDNLPDALLVREVIRTQNLPLDVHVVEDGEKAIQFIARSDEDDSA